MNTRQLLDHAKLIRLSLQQERDEDELRLLRDVVAASYGEAPGIWLLDLLELTRDEAAVVWFLASVAIDPHVRRLVNALDPTPSLDPTLDAIRRVVFGTEPSLDGYRTLSSTGRLRSLAIIERTDNERVAEHRSTWSLSQRVLTLLHGDLALDPQLTRIARTSSPIKLDELAVREEAARDLRLAMNGDPKSLVVVAGRLGLGRRSISVAVAEEVGLRVLEVRCDRLAKDTVQLKQQLRQLARECKILVCTPLMIGIDELDEASLDLVETELAAQCAGLILATCGVERPRLRWDRPTVFVELQPPSPAQLESLWSKALGSISAADAEHLADTYPLAPALIHRVGVAAQAQAAGEALTESVITSAIRGVLDDKLGEFGRRITVTQSWKDLVLPDEQARSIIELIARIRQRRTVYDRWSFGAKIGRGHGIAALMSGPAGTGKTACAGLIAKELGLEIFRADASRLQSKWIGETSKNLEQMFAAAEACRAVLLLDEADAIVGRRSEVRSSNDRHANADTSWILQRLEDFDGILLMTTNFESALDPAIQRRLAAHIRFTLPEAEERSRIWKAMITSDAPLDGDVDFDELGEKHALAGGHIKNAVLRAAFIAAEQKVTITHDLLSFSAQVEIEQMGRIATR